MGAPNRTRTDVIMLRVTDEEKAMARAVAEQQGLSISDAVRQLIRHAARRLEPTPKRRVKR